jgi:hypothetical protein
MKNSSSSINLSSILETVSGTASTELEEAPPVPQEQEPDYCASEVLCMALCGCFEYSHLESECIGPSIVRMRSKQKQISKNIFNSLVASFWQQVNELLLPDAEKRVRQYRRKKLKREEQLLPADDEIAGQPVELPAILRITQKKKKAVEEKNDPTPKVKKFKQPCCMFAGKCVGSSEKGGAKSAPTDPVYPSFVDRNGRFLSDECINYKLKF